MACWQDSITGVENPMRRHADTTTCRYLDYFFFVASDFIVHKERVFLDLGHVCFLKSSFWKIIFQTFLCLFAIRKVGQRKILFSQKKFWFGFQESIFSFGCVCFLESGFQKITFQTFLCLFAIRIVGQRKTLFSQRKIWLGFQESVFLKNLDGKHFPEVVKKLEMSLFADYINLILKLLIVIYNLFWIFIF